MPSKPLPSHLLSRTCYLTAGARDKRLFTSTFIFPIAVEITAKPGVTRSSDSFFATEGVTFDMLIHTAPKFQFPQPRNGDNGPFFSGSLGGLAETNTAVLEQCLARRGAQQMPVAIIFTIISSNAVISPGCALTADPPIRILKTCIQGRVLPLRQRTKTSNG